MANYPIASFPMSWNIANTTFINHNGAKLCIHREGGMTLEGNVKDAAYALFKYVFEQEYVPGLEMIEANKTLIIHCKDDVRLELCENIKPPEFWDELVKEFDRIVKMKVFW